eukprot:scaffold36973_cov54-Phaeocystis_antarctica.AAC.6
MPWVYASSAPVAPSTAKAVGSDSSSAGCLIRVRSAAGVHEQRDAVVDRGSRTEYEGRDAAHLIRVRVRSRRRSPEYSMVHADQSSVLPRYRGLTNPIPN